MPKATAEIVSGLSFCRPMPPDLLAKLIDEASENNITISILTQVRIQYYLMDEVEFTLKIIQYSFFGNKKIKCVYVTGDHGVPGNEHQDTAWSVQ